LLNQESFSPRALCLCGEYFLLNFWNSWNQRQQAGAFKVSLCPRDQPLFPTELSLLPRRRQ
jgi:hypothetical protein